MGLSALSKYLGIYDEFKMLRERYGIKWAVNDVIPRMLLDQNGFTSMLLREMYRRQPLLVALDKLIDKQFHRYFDDPEACMLAIGVNAILHQYFESELGPSREEIARRTARYLPKALEKCLNVIIREALRD
ncbi:hypothetical protein DRO54_10795 [Candidatus Bathyarchaeota archaeon]|nr:MAG: hypothetical protein DRO54_10795 [Candidatus Bathyarchaeota archaeon]